jgi:hypothetical protein
MLNEVLVIKRGVFFVVLLLPVLVGEYIMLFFRYNLPNFIKIRKIAYKSYIAEKNATKLMGLLNKQNQNNFI